MNKWSIITILSLLLNVALIVYILGGMKLPTKQPSKEKRVEVVEQKQKTKAQRMEEMKAYILKKERAELPLRIQELHDVRNITIDTVVITNPELYSSEDGYLVTQWEFDGHNKKDTKTVYVEISYLRESGDDCYKWSSGWGAADYEVNW